MKDLKQFNRFESNILEQKISVYNILITLHEYIKMNLNTDTTTVTNHFHNNAINKLAEFEFWYNEMISSIITQESSKYNEDKETQE